MGWLSLATRILPKVWRAGSKATSTVWKGGSAVLGTGGKALTLAARNPKATAATGIATFAGWRMLEHPEESLGTAVGKTVRGQSMKEEISHMMPSMVLLGKTPSNRLRTLPAMSSTA